MEILIVSVFPTYTEKSGSIANFKNTYKPIFAGTLYPNVSIVNADFPF